MANGSVKLSIYSTFKDDGTKKAEKAIESFTKKYGQLDKKSGTMKLDDATRSLVEQSIQADQAAAKWQGYSDKLAAAGKAVTKYVSAEAGVAVAASVKLASDFEDSFAKVKTIMDKQAVPVETLKADILELSTATGKSATELSEATYQALSASVETSKVAGFVGEAVDLAKAGFSDTTTTVDALTTIINAYRMSAEDAASISDKLVQTQNDGKTTVGELGASLGTIIPTAAALNTNLDNVMTSYALMTKQGIKTTDATTALKNTLSELSDSGSDVAGILADQTGKTFGELMAEGASLGDVLGILYQHVEGNSEEFKNLWGNMRAGTGALAIANAGTAEFNAELGKMQASTGNVERALEDLATPSGKANKAINALKNTGIELGEQYLGAMAPALAKVSGMAQDFSRSVAGMDDGQKRAAASAILLGASAGPVLLGASKVADGIATANTKLAGYTAKLAAGGAASQKMAKVTGALGKVLSGPGVAAFAGVTAVAVIAGKAIYDTWKRSDELTGATKRLTEACKAGTPSAANAAASIGQYGEVMKRTVVNADELVAAQSRIADSIAARNASSQAEISQLESARLAIESYMNQTDLTAQQQGELRAAVDLVNEQCGAQIQVLDAANGKLADQEGNLYDNVEAIFEYIDAKERQIRVDALEADRKEAYTARRDAMKELIEATRQLEEAEQHLYSLPADTPREEVAQYASQVDDLRAKHEKLQSAYDAAAESVDSLDRQLGAIVESGDDATRSLSSLVRASDAFSVFDDDILGSFVQQLENTGISVEQFAALSESQMMDLALAYDGSMQSIIAAAERMGVEVPPKARAAADGVTKALASAGPATQAQASKTTAAVLAAFDTLVGSTGEKGRSASTNLAAGIATGEPDVSGAAGAISAAASAMGNGDAYSWGNHLAQNFAAGLRDGAPVVSGAASTIAQTAHDVLGHTVPRKGPLREGGRGEAVWGEHAVENFVRGMESRAGLVARASMMVAQAASAPLANMTFGTATAGGAGYVRLDPADLAALGRTIARSMPAVEQNTTYMGNITMRERSDFTSFIQDLSMALDMEAN